MPKDSDQDNFKTVITEGAPDRAPSDKAAASKLPSNPDPAGADPAGGEARAVSPTAGTGAPPPAGPPPAGTPIATIDPRRTVMGLPPAPLRDGPPERQVPLTEARTEIRQDARAEPGPVGKNRRDVARVSDLPFARGGRVPPEEAKTQVSEVPPEALAAAIREADAANRARGAGPGGATPGRGSPAEARTVLSEPGPRGGSGGGSNQAETLRTILVDGSGAARTQMGGSAGFPTGWDRYQPVGSVGHGPNGTVYQAYDPRHRRVVAIKLVTDPGHGAGLTREALLQAQVEHRGVARVYEVGGVGGLPFVAMQFIKGPPLDEAARQMSLEQKLQVMEAMCEALEAAHKAGVLHKNLKPSNVLIERADDGSYQPVLLDFGLAASSHSVGGTIIDGGLGVANYLSPEQARGERHAIDRRSDVYSLGALFYLMLAQAPPYKGTAPVEVMGRVLREAPTPLRSHNTGVPRELEALVMRALARNPDQRYPSVRELGREIHRYLGRNPSLARTPARPRTLGQRAARRPALTAALALGAALVIGALAWGGGALWTAAEHARLVDRFTELVRSVETGMRLAHAMPEHDVRTQRRELRGRIGEIEAEMRRLGPRAQPTGELALGRAYLLLGDLEMARRHLEAAWSAGERGPAAALALGQLWSQLYDREREHAGSEGADAELSGGPRGNAIRFLEQGRGAAGGASDLLDAQILALRDQSEAALARARASFARDKRLYEARVIEGGMLDAMAQQAHRRGDIAGARDLSQKGREAVRAALELAHSYPPAHLELCRLTYRLAVLPGAGSEARLGEAAAACSAAAQVDPDNPAILATGGGVLRSAGELQVASGREPAHIDEARDLVERAIGLDPQRTASFRDLCDVHRVKGDFLASRGRDAAPSFAAALDAIRRGAATNPTIQRAFGLAVGEARVHASAAREAIWHGSSAAADSELLAATQAVARARAMDPRDYRLMALSATVKALAVELDLAASRSPAEHLEAALNDARTSSKLSNRDDPATLSLVAQLEAVEAALPRAPGSGPDERATAAERAAADAQEALLADEERSGPWRTLALATLALAQTRPEGAPAALTEAQRAIDRALALGTGDADLYLVKARILTSSATPDKVRANAAVDSALEIDPRRRLGSLCARLGRPGCK